MDRSHFSRVYVFKYTLKRRSTPYNLRDTARYVQGKKFQRLDSDSFLGVAVSRCPRRRSQVFMGTCIYSTPDLVINLDLPFVDVEARVFVSFPKSDVSFLYPLMNGTYFSVADADEVRYLVAGPLLRLINLFDQPKGIVVPFSVPPFLAAVQLEKVDQDSIPACPLDYIALSSDDEPDLNVLPFPVLTTAGSVQVEEFEPILVPVIPIIDLSSDEELIELSSDEETTPAAGFILPSPVPLSSVHGHDALVPSLFSTRQDFFDLIKNCCHGESRQEFLSSLSSFLDVNFEPGASGSAALAPRTLNELLPSASALPFEKPIDYSPTGKKNISRLFFVYDSIFPFISFSRF